jgi:transcriptional regulator with XRE-family HTH domain
LVIAFSIRDLYFFRERIAPVKHHRLNSGICNQLLHQRNKITYETSPGTMKPSEINLSKLAALLAKKRGKRPFREIAEEIGGVSSPTLSRIEKGNVPDLETFMKLCRWLGVSPQDFQQSPVESEDQEVSEQERFCALLRASRTLPPETAKALATMIQLAYKDIDKGTFDEQ